MRPARAAEASAGTAADNVVVGADYDPQTLFVFVGRERAAHTHPADRDIDTTIWQPSGRGAKTFDDASATVCDHDLALLLLEAPITNVPIASRQERRDLSIKQLGPFDGNPITLAVNEFRIGESFCDGDSGGPISSQATNAVIGVVSRRSNGANSRDTHLSYTCFDADNIVTKVSAFKPLVLEAFAAAGAQPMTEPTPPPAVGHCGVSMGAPSASSVLVAMLLALGLATARRLASGGRGP